MHCSDRATWCQIYPQHPSPGVLSFLGERYRAAGAGRWAVHAKQGASEPWPGRILVWIEPARLGAGAVEKPALSRTHKAWWDNDRSPDSRHVHVKDSWLAADIEMHQRCCSPSILAPSSGSLQPVRRNQSDPAGGRGEIAA